MKPLFEPAQRAQIIFGEPMEPCPKCGSYDIRHQTPIVMDMPDNPTDTKAWVKAWYKATENGETPLQGPVYIECSDCLHKGPSLDCSGRTSEDVRSDPKVGREVKRLWNIQKKTSS